MAALWRACAEVVWPAEWSSSLLGWELKNTFLRQAGMRLGKGSGVARGFWCNRGGEKWITIGEHSGLAYEATVICNGKITIGKCTTIAADATLINWDCRSRTSSECLEIGDGCWIGASATIVGPIKIGDFAVIGGGAIVTADVPARAIVAGVPAEVIRLRNLPRAQWYGGGLSFDTVTQELVRDGC